MLSGDNSDVDTTCQKPDTDSSSAEQLTIYLEMCVCTYSIILRYSEDDSVVCRCFLPFYSYPIASEMGSRRLSRYYVHVP